MADQYSQFELNIDVFKAIISLLDFDVNAAENQGWIKELFDQAKPLSDEGIDVQLIPDLILKSGKAPTQFTARFSAMEEANRRAATQGKIKPFDTIQSYFKAEKDYQAAFAAVPGLDDLGTAENIKTLITNDVAVAEVGDRLKNALFAVESADAGLKAEIKKMFPSATDTDLARSLILGDTSALKGAQKIGQAEILTEAKAAGLSLVSDVEQLQKRGVTREKAAAGSASIAASQAGLGAAAKRFGEDTMGLQQELEETAFGLSDGKRVKRLASQARAEFGKQSGITTGSLSRRKAGQL